ncbi:hypothetical protein [Amaricoccus solimangrovi]|uniref:Uncharacterized protein n=1 Tax=Amaricoccus solimangrovi TaxID=2589815 RepID=A0A501WS08_9RHOB|nr:hypothetical protein [Amaricoccus solimangrovi]TPE52239.1 hypothetical protein FJM51_07425 [Amaricoccus solimangrovi]
MLYQTIRVSSCVSIQGEFVESLANGDVLVRDGRKLYRGQPIRRGDRSFSAGIVRPIQPASAPEAV